MEVLDIVLDRPYIIPPIVVTAMLFKIMKYLKCVQVLEYVDICILRPLTIPIAIADFIIVVTMLEVNIGLKRPATLPLSTLEFIIVGIKVLTMVEMDIGLKIPATTPLVIMYQEFMLMEEADIVIRPATLPPINLVAAVDCRVSNFLLVLLTKKLRR